MGRPLTTEAPPAAAATERPSIPINKNWLQNWLVCVAFFYPVFWLSNSVMWAAPALVRVALFGYKMDGLSLSPFGAAASSLAPQPPGGVDSGWTGSGSNSLVMAAVLVLAGALLVALVGHRARIVSGLAIAALGDVALAHGLRRVFGFQRMSAEALLGSVLFFAVLCFGLRWMLSGWPSGGFWSRLGNLLAGFVLLPVLPWVWFSLSRGFGLWIFAIMLMAPAAVAAVLVSLRPVPPAAAEAQRAGWRTVALGVLTFLLLVAGVRAGRAAIERARLVRTWEAMAAYPKIPVGAPYPKAFFQKGVSVSAEGWGGYESESGRRMLERLRQDGVNAVAIVPYGFVQRGNSEVGLNTGAGSWESDVGLEQMSQVAHALGMKVMLKPGIWVGGGGYAGELEYPSPQARARWFDEYGRFAEHYARLATRIHADLFCVGGEFEKLTPYEGEWRKLIARMRELYPGPLVYAANWGEEFESVKFWDALDYIGLQDYYPLPDDLSTDAVVEKVEAVQQKYQRPVVFTEVGFASAEGANTRPWEDGRGAKPALDLQARCYQAVFNAFYAKPWFHGMYWWKVGTNGFGGREDTSLTPWGKPAMDVVKQWYTRPGR